MITVFQFLDEMCLCFCRSCIFYRACMDIPRGTELLVWYNDSYTSFFGIPLQCIAQDENCERTLLFFLTSLFLFFLSFFLSFFLAFFLSCFLSFLPSSLPLCWTPTCIFDQLQKGFSRANPLFSGHTTNHLVTLRLPQLPRGKTKHRALLKSSAQCFRC